LKEFFDAEQSAFRLIRSQGFRAYALQSRSAQILTDSKKTAKAILENPRLKYKPVRGWFIQNNPDLMFNLAYFECDRKWNGRYLEVNYVVEVKAFILTISMDFPDQHRRSVVAN
jgi:hypothetical protein